ncbi:hypothetical protein RvY_03488 [Ramazzottius varieornatus]|uniref:Mediator of RNA polymerase II transcription subunit 10 n=1 Tax=Ramazzottius varieornatus TaxID=947166 RepID=A0A1D1UP13_RAMVA|nr:hypothetical protein RvY_03488 [Ramazzottius varieornatus]
MEYTYGQSNAGLGNHQPGRDQLDHFKELLESVMESYRELGIIVSDVQPTSQPVINQRLNGQINGLRELDYAKGALGDIRVPFEVVQYVDQGLNPQSYTKDCMEKSIQKNEEVKGKIDAFKKFRAHLLVELARSFPNEMAKYRAMRGDTAGERREAGGPL